MQPISQGNVYRSDINEAYTTNDLHDIEAHEHVYSEPVSSWVRQDVKESGRFSTAATLEGEVKRTLEFLHRYETADRKTPPSDYFGIDG